MGALEPWAGSLEPFAACPVEEGLTVEVSKEGVEARELLTFWSFWDRRGPLSQLGRSL